MRVVYFKKLINVGWIICVFIVRVVLCMFCCVINLVIIFFSFIFLLFDNIFVVVFFWVESFVLISLRWLYFVLRLECLVFMLLENWLILFNILFMLFIEFEFSVFLNELSILNIFCLFLEVFLKVDFGFEFIFNVILFDILIIILVVLEIV